LIPEEGGKKGGMVWRRVKAWERQKRNVQKGGVERKKENV